MFENIVGVGGGPWLSLFAKEPFPTKVIKQVSAEKARDQIR